MAGWFNETINQHQEVLGEEERKRNDAEAQAERERDEFRAGFEFAIANNVEPAFKSFVENANEHGFPSSFVKEVDARGRLRAVKLGIYAVAGAEVHGHGLEHCAYKITLQMNTRRIAHMMTFDGVAGAERDTQNNFLDLDSLEESALEERMREFLNLSLKYCQGISG
jgi:hypothetical protein